MEPSDISFLWREPDCTSRFTSAVCLHGHTMHSEECLSFLPRYLHAVPGLSRLVSQYESGPKPAVDFSRAYWTPPLTPSAALHLEQAQITKLNLKPIVSLTDHDNIDAGMSLQVAAQASDVPVSVEWTVPYRRSIFHLGIHNLRPADAQAWMGAMAAYTAAPDENILRQILSECSRISGVLIVLNHPFWLEEGILESDHGPALAGLLDQCKEWLHAIELNGTRTWDENSRAVELARAYSKPLISGGDRHACEPAACLNLTNSRSFGEFACEVRDGQSSVLFLPHYREPMALRLLEASWDILRPYPEYPGRERWTDRLFYRCLDGGAVSLATLWRDRVPLVLLPAPGMVQFLATDPVRMAIRMWLNRRQPLMQ